jgi:hypothetical protein
MAQMNIISRNPRPRQEAPYPRTWFLSTQHGKALKLAVRAFKRQELPRSSAMKLPSIIEWFRILRAHHQWTMFQAIRYALWLAK